MGVSMEMSPFTMTFIQWPSSGSTSVEKLIVREPGGSISTNFGSKAHSDLRRYIPIELEKARWHCTSGSFHFLSPFSILPHCTSRLEVL